GSISSVGFPEAARGGEALRLVVAQRRLVVAPLRSDRTRQAGEASRRAGIAATEPVIDAGLSAPAAAGDGAGGAGVDAGSGAGGAGIEGGSVLLLEGEIEEEQGA